MQLIGEGYLEEVTLDNLTSVYQSSLIEDPETSDLLADEDLAALKSNSIHFGDCYINEQKQLLFTIKNMSKSQCYRFEWPPFTHQSSMSAGGTSNTLADTTSVFSVAAASSATPLVQFSPRVGHLHAGCVKDIKVTFRSNQPKVLKELVQCILTKISFDQPIDEVIHSKFILLSLHSM